MTALGCVLIAIGTILAAFSVNEKRRNVVVTVGGVLVALGTWVTIHAGEKDTARVQSSLESTSNELHQTRVELENTRVDSEERFQRVMVVLNATKTGEAEKISSEKIRFIQDDIDKWAGDLAKNGTDLKGILAKQTRQAQEERENTKTQAQVRSTGEASEEFAFAITLFKDLVGAYEKKKGRQVDFNIPDLPANFYKTHFAGEVKFGGKAVWKVEVQTGGDAPGNPDLVFRFVSYEGQNSGLMSFRVEKGENHLFAYYHSDIPDPPQIREGCDLSVCDTLIRKTLQTVLRTQLLQTEGQ